MRHMRHIAGGWLEMEGGSKMDDVVPFGKYKGQPVVALAQDQQYAEWLVAQPWFRERYATIYNVIVNNFGQVSEDTPQHNAAQALFLDDAFCVSFVKTVVPQWPEKQMCTLIDNLSEQMKLGNLDKWYRNELEVAVAWQRGEIDGTAKVGVGFETGKTKLAYPDSRWALLAVDVLLEVEYKCGEFSFAYQCFRIEVKPSVGDDYPSVLRQMKRERADTLFIGEYVGEGVTREQFVKIFNNEGIRVVFRLSVAA
jgi:hypothetical protein